MSREEQLRAVVENRVLYDLPGTDRVAVEKDLVYHGAVGDALTLDVYSPAEMPAGSELPVVVFVTGYPDPGFSAMFGCNAKEIGQYTSWGRLIAASGMIGVTYSNRDPERDVERVLDFLRDSCAELSIDRDRISLFACSGNVPNALATLYRQPAGVRCAALLYGFLLDSEDTQAVAESSQTFGFVNPTAGRTVAELAADRPMLLVRAGRDEFAGILDSIDRFTAEALRLNLPVTVANYSTCPHAFEALDARSAERVVKQVVAFFQFHSRTDDSLTGDMPALEGQGGD